MKKELPIIYNNEFAEELFKVASNPITMNEIMEDKFNIGAIGFSTKPFREGGPISYQFFDIYSADESSSNLWACVSSRGFNAEFHENRLTFLRKNKRIKRQVELFSLSKPYGIQALFVTGISEVILLTQEQVDKAYTLVDRFGHAYHPEEYLRKHIQSGALPIKEIYKLKNKNYFGNERLTP